MKRKIISLLGVAVLIAMALPIISPPPVSAAFPSVLSITETAFGTSNQTHNVQMPATVAPDDLLIVLFTVAHSGSGDPATVTTPGGWTLLDEEVNSGTGDDLRLSVYYKKAAGTEDGTTVDFYTSSNARAAAQVYRIGAASWHTTTPPEISAAAESNNDNPNPSSLDPTGWGTEDTLWIAAAGFADDPGTTSYPASYTDGEQTQGGGSGSPDCQLNSARRQLNAGSEDPGEFDLAGDARWVAFTIAIRPAPTCTNYYLDEDDDGYGTGDPECLTSPPGYNWAAVGGDCDDTDADVNPGATEVCDDGIDNDCDGYTDCADTGDCPAYYRDNDDDDYGQSGDSQCLYDESGNYTATVDGDCDDTDPDINPDATEVCDGIDNDCDGETDEEGADGCTTYYKDVDNDTYGVTGDSQCLCDPEGDYTATRGGDCDDNDADVNPGAAEVCDDGIDNDCDGDVDCDDPDCAAGEPPYLEVDKGASPNPNCGQAQVTLNVTGVGDPGCERIPVDVMLIIDVSWSMNGDKIDAAKAAAAAFVDLLDDSKDRVGLVSYSDSATLNQGLTSNFNSVKSAINGLSAVFGYTNIGAGIDFANEELIDNGRSEAVWVEILLTDGVPNRPYDGFSGDFNELDAAYARTFAQAAHNAGITLYTIGLGESPDISYYFLDDLPASGHTYNPGDPAGHPYDEDGLAYIGGGSYYHAPTTDDLEFMFEEISAEITNIAGTNVVVTEVLPEGVNYVNGSASIPPTSISPDGQTLTWEIGIISIGETWTVTFNVTFDDPGYQLVDEYPDTRVDYIDYQSDPASEVFPRTYITVLDCDDLDGWVADGGNYTVCNGTDVCTYQDMVYLDYECVGGNCVPTEIDWRTDLIDCVSCDDGDPCTIDSCVDGECVHTPIDCDYLDDWYEDGGNYTVCNGTDVCTYQDMVYLDYECVGGECVPTPTDWRTDLIGCESCDDGDPCTIDTCENGACVHTPINCDYRDGWVADGGNYTVCNGTDVCTYQDWVYLDYECVGGECVPAEKGRRTDLIGCESCDDGDPCTIDTCVNGTCVHTPIDCDDRDDWYEDGGNYTVCNGTDVCTYQDWVYLDYECVDGECVPAETDWRTDLISCESCDDEDPCTIDTCVNGTCVHTPIDCDELDDWYEDGDPYTECDGDLVCTYQDMVYLDYECVGGECVPAETDWRTDLIDCVSCDDDNPCTIDTCVNGTCVHIWAGPTATASSNSPVNQGATIELYGGPAGMASYNWTGPGGWTSSDRNPTRSGATTAMAGIYTLVVTSENGCSDDATTSVVVITPRPPTGGGGGGGCPLPKYLTVDWEGCNTTKQLYSNGKLVMDLLGPSFDGMHNLLLELGTHAPVVGGKTYYRIIIRELADEDIPPLAENIIAVVVFNITPDDAVFDKDIFLTLGLDELQLPGNALNVTMAYYDDVDGWVPLEYDAGGPNGVAELTLSAPINHFSIFGVLAELAPIPPAHFVASGLNIEPSVERIWEPVTFVTKIGESVTITANIVNDGWQEGTYTAVLKLNGQTVDTKMVTLGAGQSQPVSFTPLSGLDYGDYEVEAAGLSGGFTVSRTITWWLIIVIIAAIGLIIWGVVWSRRRRKARQEA